MKIYNSVAEMWELWYNGRTMKNENVTVQKVGRTDAEKALGASMQQLREGEKPSAPANLVLPKPVAMPAPKQKSGK